MSIFKDKAIVTKVEKLKDKDFLYTLFTYEYWKIRANKKISLKEKPLDLWYIINFEIVTSPNAKIHKIKNIKIKSEFRNTKSFEELNLYLEILSIIYREIPDWLSNKEIFTLVEFINNDEKIDKNKLLLTKLKLKSLLWNLPNNNENKTIEKYLNIINENKIDKIFLISNLDDNMYNMLLLF